MTDSTSLVIPPSHFPLLKIEPIENSVINSNKKINQIGKANSLLSQLPTLMASQQLATAYKVVIPPGVTGELMKYKNGMLGTPIVENGKVVGHAGLESLSSMASPLLVFSAVSILTGQYFLAEINQSIQNVISKIEELKDIILLKEESLLFSCSSFLQRITINFPQVIESDKLKLATIVNVQMSINQLASSIYFYGIQITKTLDKISDSIFDKKSDIEKLKKELYNYIENLSTAMDLRKMFVLIEFTLSQSFDDISIKNTIENIKRENELSFGPIFKNISSNKKKVALEIVDKTTNNKKQNISKELFHYFDELENEMNSRYVDYYNKNMEHAFLNLSTINDKGIEFFIVDDGIYTEGIAQQVN